MVLYALTVGGVLQWIIDLLFTVSMLTIMAYATLYWTEAIAGRFGRQKIPVMTKMTGEHPTVSIMFPMHNEGPVVASTLETTLKINYPMDKIEIIAIDDNSTDNTGLLLDEYARKYPNIITVIHRGADKKRGKPAALNDALKVARGEVMVIFDADHKPEPDSVRLLVNRLMSSGPEVGAIQGRTSYINENENMMTKVISKDRDAGLFCYLKALDVLNLPIYAAGSTIAIRREVFSRVGLWDDQSVTEDTEFSTRMYLNGYKIKSEPMARSFEEAVNNFSALRKRTYRWARGHDNVLFRYLWKVLRSKYFTRVQKIYMMLHLFFYAAPTVTMMGMALYCISFAMPLNAFFISWAFNDWIIFTVFYFVYCFFSIFAFYGVGLKLAGKKVRDMWTFFIYILLAFVNVWVCTKAFLDEVVGKEYVWAKTPRSGVSTIENG